MKLHIDEHHKKIKWVLMTAAIVLGIGGAILTRPHSAASKPDRPFFAAGGCAQSKPDQTVEPLADK